MSDRQELIKRRDSVLGEARAVVEKCAREGREMARDEAEQVHAAIAEAKSCNETLTADDRARGIMSELDAQAASSSGVLGGSGQHLALTGVYQKAMTDRIIAAIPHDPSGSKALVSGGTQTVSSILLHQVVASGRPAVSVLDVLPTRIVPPVYFFLRQNSRSLAAAPTAAGASKPVSDVGVTSVTNRLRVVATISLALDHFVLQDNTNLSAFVGEELVYAVRVALENEILNGDGTGEHFTGVLSTSGILSQSFSTNALTSMRKAITSLDGQGYTPSVIVLHGNDWEAIELLTAYRHRRRHRYARRPGGPSLKKAMGVSSGDQQRARRENRVSDRRRQRRRRQLRAVRDEMDRRRRRRYFEEPGALPRGDPSRCQCRAAECCGEGRDAGVICVHDVKVLMAVSTSSSVG